MTSLEILSKIEEKAKQLGISCFGVVKPFPVPFIKKYKETLKKIDLGDLKYLKNFKIREEPNKLLPYLKSIIAFLFPYKFDKRKALNLEKYKIAQFALYGDYHIKIKEKLKKIAELIPAECKILCDTSPFLEKPYGFKAGLGFIGKNTLLINKDYGSAFNLGFILTSMELPEKKLKILNGCGKCKRCIEVCPTGAIEKAYILNPIKCISYLTIEAKNIPEMPKERWGYVYGCDLCQAVCPYNENLKGEFEAKKEIILERISKKRMEENKKFVEKEKFSFYLKKNELFYPLSPEERKKLLSNPVEFIKKSQLISPAISFEIFLNL